MISTLLTIFSFSLLWAMSPGPWLVVVSKNVIAYGRTHGFATALWISLALFTYGLIAVTWLWILIQDNVQLFLGIKTLWSVYIAYLWYTLLTTKTTPLDTVNISKKHSQTVFSSVAQWYLSNIWDPAVILFIIAIFSQLVWWETSILFYSLSVLSISFSALVRFGAVSCLIWYNKIQTKLHSNQWVVNKVFGVLLLLLAWMVLLG